MNGCDKDTHQRDVIESPYGPIGHICDTCKTICLTNEGELQYYSFVITKKPNTQLIIKVDDA